MHAPINSPSASIIVRLNLFIKKTASPMGMNCKVDGGGTRWRDNDSLPSLATPSTRNVNFTTSGFADALSFTISVCNNKSEVSIDKFTHMLGNNTLNSHYLLCLILSRHSVVCQHQLFQLLLDNQPELCVQIPVPVPHKCFEANQIL